MAGFEESRSELAFSACKIEAAYNENPALVGTDGFLTCDAVTCEADINMLVTRVHTSSFTRRKNVPTIRLFRQQVSFYLQGFPSATTPDKQVPLLRCAGVHETITTDSRYTPATIAQLKSAKLYTEIDGFEHVTPGMYGDFSIAFASGEPPKVRFDGLGQYVAPAAATLAWAPGDPSNYHPWLDAELSLASSTDTLANTPIISAEFRRGIQIGRIPDANSSTGLGKTFVADAEPHFMLTLGLAANTDAGLTYPEMCAHLLASDVFNNSFKYKPLTPAAGQTWTFNMPELQAQSVRRGTGDRYNTVVLDFLVQHDNDNQEFEFVVT